MNPTQIHWPERSVALACLLFALGATRGSYAAGDDESPGALKFGGAPRSEAKDAKPNPKPKPAAAEATTPQAPHQKQQPQQQQQPHNQAQPAERAPTVRNAPPNRAAFPATDFDRPGIGAAVPGTTVEPPRKPVLAPVPATVPNVVVTEPTRQPVQRAQPSPAQQVAQPQVPRTLPATDFDRPAIGAQIQSDSQRTPAPNPKLKAVVAEPLRQADQRHAPGQSPQKVTQPVPRLPGPDFDRPGIGASVQSEPPRTARPEPKAVPPEPWGQSGFTVHRRDPDGSRLVVAKPHGPNHNAPVWGYREHERPGQQDLVRLYPDGHRVIIGRDYDRQSWGGYDFVRYRDGLRAGFLPDGRTAFQDRVVTVGGKPVVERLRYVTWVDGRPHFGHRPITRHYDWVPIGSAPVPCFRPRPWAADWTRIIYMPLALPVIWNQVIVSNSWVRYQSPAVSYSDPLLMLGDLQISGAFQEGYGYVQPVNGTPIYLAPEVQQLRSELTDIQTQVQPVTSPPLVQPPAPVVVNDAIRTQMRKQVRLAVAMQQNGHAMRLPDLLRSGYAEIYLFQVGQPTQLPDLSNGADCVLQAGDLLRFDVVPSDANQLMRLRVEARGAGSCPVGHVVQIAPSELQDMLNSFAERVEDNVQRLAACKPGSSC